MNLCIEQYCSEEAEPGGQFCEDHAMNKAMMNTVNILHTTQGNTLGSLVGKIKQARAAGLITTSVGNYA